MYNANKWIEDRAATDGEHAKLADENWTVVQKHCISKSQQSEESGEVWRFVKRQCLHCEEPACASACFAKAFQKTETGPVVYYPHNCVGCRSCMIACPFNIPKYEWEKPIPVLTKCMMCSTKVAKGERPACVSVCPTNVMKFGEREELLAEAKELLARDSKYVQHIYGEKEAGGTCWIYISDTPFEQLGFKMDVPKKSMPAYTSKYMHFTPIFGAAWAFVLTGLYFITKRKEQIAEEKHHKNKTEK
jgi:formate dehydrogenase iron-sulfur subunit